ncbi:putative membrane fusion protein SilB [Flavobacteriaceae bacterium UJ101]|nr:putative membrane fusion protein SilB [Flavobacteriaceae bacterium UJ101]
MKKIAPYSIVLGIGLLLGWLFFGGDHENKSISNSQQEKIEEHQHNEVEEWTCSMHPQIRQPEPGDCPICGMDLIPVEANNSKSETILKNDQIKMTDHALALANVQTTLIGFNNVDDTIQNNELELSGQIEENESSLYTQTAHIGGRLENFSVTYEGEYVKKGQLIGAIYSPEIVTAQQELLIASESKKIQPEIYHAVKQKLRLWKLSNTEINEIERTKKIKTNFPLYADASGIVKQKMATIGTHVQAGAPLYTLTNLSKVWVILEAYEKDIQYLKVGQTVSIKTSAYPDELFKGTISFIEPTLNTQTRTIPIRVEIVNKSMKLKPGMLATATIEHQSNQTKQPMLMIPKSAVIWTGKRSVVYLKPNPEEPVFEMREVELGNRIGQNFQVIQGVNEGDEIVTHGAFTIDSAAQLLGKKSVMNSSKEDLQKEDTVFEVDITFQNQLKSFYNAYIQYKDFLVNDQAVEAHDQAKNTLKLLNEIDENTLSDSAKSYWHTLKKELNTSLESILTSTDISIQRNHFKHLSKYLLAAIKAFGIEQNVYELFCPMVDDDKGASWLSNDHQILNPYYGSKMLKCGEVKQEIISK